MEFITASLASMNANLFTHPLETIKVRQIMHGGSTLSIGVDMVKNEGLGSLYKGINAALIRAVISGGGRLYGYQMLKKQAVKYEVIDKEPRVSQMPILGGLAITAACLAQYAASPIDLIRTRQASSKGKTGTPSIVKVATDVVKAEGFTGLFSGSTALMVRAATFNLGQLLTYDKCKSEGMRRFQLEQDDLRVHLFASLGAGFVATTFSCPAENLKTYGQLQGKTPLSEAIKKIWKIDGYKTFFRGWTPLYMKIAPHTVLVFVTMERLNALFLEK